jgi:hypothetical protein
MPWLPGRWREGRAGAARAGGAGAGARDGTGMACPCPSGGRKRAAGARLTAGGWQLGAGNRAERSRRRRDSGGPARGARIARAGPGPTRTLGPLRPDPSRPADARFASESRTRGGCATVTRTRTLGIANKRFRFSGQHFVGGLLRAGRSRAAGGGREPDECRSLPPRRAGHHREASRTTNDSAMNALR